MRNAIIAAIVSAIIASSSTFAITSPNVWKTPYDAQQDARIHAYISDMYTYNVRVCALKTWEDHSGRFNTNDAERFACAHNMNVIARRVK